MIGKKRIEDYALIGDGETAAIIARDGTIEWACFPRFDSEACFAALVGDEENGCWSLRPTGSVRRTTRRYRGDTLILETEFETDTGTIRLIDFMPMRGEAPDIVRVVEGVEGEVDIVSEVVLRFDYGRIHPLVHVLDDGHATAVAGPNGIAMRADAEIEHADRRLRSRRRVRAGERASFVMTWYPSHEAVPEPVDVAAALSETESYWQNWAARISFPGEYRDQVVRSMVTLKALTYRPTGGIVAGCTSSLPESPGGARNWDYRYCWLRDATLILLAFDRLELGEEARHWIEWLARAIGGEPIVLQPFFAVDGARRIPEWEAGWLAGFNGAQPVRFGNGAGHQLQLDIFGEVTAALCQAIRMGLTSGGEGARLVRLLVDKLGKVWREPDAGIWESRGPSRHHTYSKAMCWVAFDNAATLFAHSDADAAARYRSLADEVRQAVFEKGFNGARNTFTAAFDSHALDAALLRLPLVGFVEAHDPRMAGTIAAIEQSLCREGLVWRYEPEAFGDGVGGKEGAFIAACFWLAEVYCLQGRRADSLALFQRTLGYANDLYLLSEEACPGSDARLLGNFPQGLSHVALVSCAHRLFAQ